MLVSAFFRMPTQSRGHGTLFIGLIVHAGINNAAEDRGRFY